MIQVASSQAILDYVMDRRDELTVIEAGVLYGYPISHALGYSGMIDRQWKNEKISQNFSCQECTQRRMHIGSRNILRMCGAKLLGRVQVSVSMRRIFIMSIV